MNAGDYLGRYAEGWTKGDAEMILSAASESFAFDDPNAGAIAREDFTEYLAGLREAVTAVRGAESGDSFMEISEVITQETDDGLSASCWWTIPGTDIQGSGLIKVGSDGVKSERIAYYTKLPE
ncbi:MAG: nuclear transport factor 2 family protein [Proteobacteria bacterium]|nr:nuclear transport factor 2 family protein [Pseudomonadota bacterium]